MLNSKFKKFLLYFSVYTAIILLISFALYQWLPELHLNKWFLFILLFLYLVAVLSFFFSSRSYDAQLSKFANRYMLLNFGRLILFSVVIFVYASLHKEDAASFTITFFSYYLLMTAWEVASLWKIKQ